MQAIAQLTTVRELRNEALLCLNAMCAIKLPRERMYVLMETVTKIVDAVKHALAQVGRGGHRMLSISIYRAHEECFRVIVIPMWALASNVLAEGLVVPRETANA